VDDIKQLFFGNMSERAAKIMEEDMEALGAVRKREVDDARSSVMETAKSPSESGELVLPGGGEDDKPVY
jgi:flagellar motor switch protein FliG|tara:strand:- start:998 stop:1204 length:207 start_codon:yes stop_codon:yes gene_type:complete